MGEIWNYFTIASILNKHPGVFYFPANFCVYERERERKRERERDDHSTICKDLFSKLWDILYEVPSIKLFDEYER